MGKVRKVARISTKVKTITKKKQNVAETKENEFNVTVSRLALKKAVDMVANALPGKDYGDAKSGIFLEAKYNGDKPMLYLTANSLNVFICHGIELQDDIGEGFVVPNGNSFHKIVSGLQPLKNPIELSYDGEDDLFEIRCGSEYSSNIQHYASAEFVFPPTADEIKQRNDEVTLQVKYIIEALDKVSFACSNDSSIPALTGVLIEQTKETINFVGGDGGRIAYLSIKSRVKNPKKVIVGAKHLRLLNSIFKALEVKMSTAITLYLSDDKIYFISDNTVVGIQIFAGEYPIDGGYEQFVHDMDECETTLTLDVAGFLEKLDLATLHNHSAFEPVCIEFSKLKNKKMKFKLVNSEVSGNSFGVSFDVVKYSGDMDKELIAFTPVYVYDILKSISTKQVVLGFINESEAIIRPVGNESESYCYTFSLN